jgi:BASS family bile acid:Na+ symporter
MKAMDLIARLSRDRNAILVFSIAVGLGWNGAAPYLKHLVLPALAVVMTFSTVDVMRGGFGSARATLPAALAGIVMNYLVLAPLILGLNWLLIGNEAFRVGFVLMAAVPPAVAVVPFTLFLKGDVGFALFGTVGGYLGALGIMPLIILTFLGAGSIDPLNLAVIIAELIVAPLIAARILVATGLVRHVERLRGTVINWSFFLISYVIIGLNRELLFSDPLSLVPSAIIAIASTLLLGGAIEVVGRLFNVGQGVIVPLLLLGTLKNYGLSGGLALALFDRETAMPSTLASVMMIAYIIVLGLRKGRT